jgi:hypothetical protein
MSARASQVKSGVRVRPGLHLVPRRKRRLIKRGRGTRFAPIALVGAILVGAIVFGVLLEQVILAQSAFKLTRINDRVASSEAKHEELLLTAAKLEAPGRIEHYARTRLGMVDPTVVEYIVADVPRRMGKRLAERNSDGDLASGPAVVGAAAEVGAP